MAGLFSEWLNKDAPVGLEAIRRRIISESSPLPGLPSNNQSPQNNDVKPQSTIGDIEDDSDSSRLDQIQERRRQILKSKRDELSALSQEDADFDERKFGKLRTAVRGLLEQRMQNDGSKPEEQRERWLNILALAHTTPGKERRGNAQSLTHRDASTLNDPLVQQTLREGIGDGSPEQVKKFIESRLTGNVPLNLVSQIFKTLPSDSPFKNLLKSGSQNKKIDLWDEDKQSTYKYTSTNENFLGVDDQGNELRGTSKQGRQLLLLKRFLDQGGRDGYTGHELDPRFMELEHVIGTSQMVQRDDGTLRPPTLEEYRQRENAANWLWIATGINSFKGEKPLGQALDKIQGMTDKINEGEDAWGVNLEQGLLDEQKKQKGVSSLIEGMFDDNQNFKQEVTSDAVGALFDNEMSQFQELNPGSSKVPIGLSKAIAKKLGMSRSFQQNGSYYLHQELLRPMIMNILSKDQEGRIDMLSDYRARWLASRSDAKRLFDLDKSAPDDEELGHLVQMKDDGSFNMGGTWGNILYRRLAEVGLFTREDLENESYFPSNKKRNALKRSFPFLWEDTANESYRPEEHYTTLFEGIDFGTFLS